jgi:predicted HTH transcriptional regulator
MHYEEILKKGEGKTVEFKRDFSSPQNIIKTIIAFANSAGGELFVGIEDNGKVVGIKNDIKEEERISNLISDNIVPRIVPDIYFLTIKNKTVLLIEVYPSSRRPHYYKKFGKLSGTFIRIGSTNRNADIDLIVELERTANNEHFDEMLNPFSTIKDIDIPEIKKAYKGIHRIDDNELETIGIIKKEGKKLGVSNAGIILFGKNRRKFFPSLYIQCARFNGVTKANISDYLDIDKYPYLAIDDVLFFVKKHAMKSIRIEGSNRVDSYNVPLVAIRELIVNAIVHSDYSIKGSNIKIAIFDNRIEIENPGLLYPGLTIEDIKQNGKSRLRNPIIGGIFKDIEKFEKWGSGISRVISECEKMKLKEPLFEEVADAFRVTIYINISPKKVADKLGEKVDDFLVDKYLVDKKYDKVENMGDIILKYLSENEYITNSIARAILNKSATTTRRVFKYLDENGLVKTTGINKSKKYFLR